MEATASEKNAESSSDTCASQDETIHLSTGEFTLAQLEAVFATIPLDITFVDANDKTRYFSHGDTRAFPRPKSCLGRDVYDCHPPKSATSQSFGSRPWVSSCTFATLPFVMRRATTLVPLKPRRISDLSKHLKARIAADLTRKGALTPT